MAAQPLDIHIPAAALEEGKRCICLNGCGPDVQCDYCLKTARACFLAMVKAWSGAVRGNRVDDGTPWIKLPLKEKPDAE